jgi:hypothetical protein
VGVSLLLIVVCFSVLPFWSVEQNCNISTYHIQKTGSTNDSVPTCQMRSDNSNDSVPACMVGYVQLT